MAAVRGGRSWVRGRCGHRQDGAAGVGGGAGGWHSGGPVAGLRRRWGWGSPGAPVAGAVWAGWGV